MCIRDRFSAVNKIRPHREGEKIAVFGIGGLGQTALQLLKACLLYTSDAADERSSVDLGGRRIIKKKNTQQSDRGCTSNIN